LESREATAAVLAGKKIPVKKIFLNKKLVFPG